ncbi:glycosyltransferase family 4 protein [Methanobacterium sp.]|uniref:glycosyltransferase family 4 protein n=1 Tax=Methanobacterium sp. TaxID=2164 RepID=UPI003C715FCB
MFKKYMIMAAAKYIIIGEVNVVKILFVHNTAMPYRIPFFKKLTEQYDVDFIFTHFQRSFKRRGMKASIHELEDSDYKILDNRLPMENALNLLFVLLKSDFDIVVGSIDYIPPSALITNSLCFFIGKLKGKKTIFWSEEWGWPMHPLRKIISPFLNYIIRNCDVLIVPGKRHEKHVISLGAPVKKVFILPNGTNLTRKSSDYLKMEKLRYKWQNQKIILYVGQLRKLKGIHYLIKAFAKLRYKVENVILLIIGKGEYEDKLNNLCKELNIANKVYFLGFIKNEDLGPYYLLADLFVMPSVTDKGFAEAWGLVVNESMTFETPVIATNAVGCAFEMIENDVNGYIIPEKDENALYKSMLKVLSDNYLMEKMGKNSRVKVEKEFTYEKMVNGFNQTIKFLRIP